MTDFTVTQVAANIYKGMQDHRQMHGESFRATWGDDPEIAARESIDLYKSYEDFESQLNDADFRKDVVAEVVEFIEDEMELNCVDGEDVMPDFTHVAITWEPGLAYIAEAKTASEAIDALRRDVSGDFESDGLRFYRITTYEAGRIHDIDDFDRIIRATDEREIEM